MRRKEKWMFKGAIVLASGKKAVIEKMEENNIDGANYVYYIYCKVEGMKVAGCYHPGDVRELIIQPNTPQ